MVIPLVNSFMIIHINYLIYVLDATVVFYCINSFSFNALNISDTLNILYMQYLRYILVSHTLYKINGTGNLKM